jgi:hypothetical protein
MTKSVIRNRMSLIVLAVMIIGGLLAVTWPVWIAPPNTSITLWLYLILLVLWFPVLIIVFAMQSHRSKSRFFLLLVAGVLMTVIAMVFAASNIGAALIEPKDCISREVSPGQTEYTCTLYGILSHQIYTLQGPTGSPFVYFVSYKFVGTL